MAAADTERDGLSEATSGDGQPAKFWAEQIRMAGETEKDWRDDAKRIQHRYRNEGPDGKRSRGTKFPIFWSNVQVLKPNVYSATPRPDVRRRDRGSNPVGNEAAAVIEAGLKYEIDNATFNAALEAVRDDMLVPGRGVAREVYAFDQVRRTDVLQQPGAVVVDPWTGEQTQAPPTYMLDGLPVQPDGFEDEEQLVPYIDTIENERTETRYVFWADYRQSPARCWSEVWWVAFRHAMDKDELKREFEGHDPQDIPRPLSANATSGANRADDMPPDPESPFGRAEVWEIWSKRDRKRLWIATGYDKVLREDEDPLRLEGFFPCPCPLYAVPTTDQMVPMPELAIYEPLADELDEIQQRLRSLTKQAKFIGLFDGDFVEMASLPDMQDGDFRPIARPEAAAADLRGAIWTWPIGEIVQAIALLTNRSEALKQAIYELTGISDLRRGIGKERESAAAQKLKASYGAARMTPRSQPMAEFCRDLLRIKAEIMAEHFEPASLERVSGIPLPPQGIDPETRKPIPHPVVLLLRDEKFRLTTIDVETDSTVAPDAEADKAEAVEFASAVTELTTAWAPLLTAAPAVAGPLYGALLKTTTGRFKFARELEPTIDQTVAQMVAMPAMQPAPVDPMAAAGPPQMGLAA
ncbi:MAG: hypothetical protein AB7O44_27350 [Hyphomicrobiaceae bacterium]|uniref:hypothetical protein n=1 Tax=Hyphomicrobium sp. TaxID=82 RepID=UPI003D1240D1